MNEELTQKTIYQLLTMANTMHTEIFNIGLVMPSKKLETYRARLTVISLDLKTVADHFTQLVDLITRVLQRKNLERAFTPLITYTPKNCGIIAAFYRPACCLPLNVHEVDRLTDVPPVYLSRLVNHTYIINLNNFIIQGRPGNCGDSLPFVAPCKFGDHCRRDKCTFYHRGGPRNFTVKSWVRRRLNSVTSLQADIQALTAEQLEQERETREAQLIHDIYIYLTIAIHKKNESQASC
jgi:hypothetical protein